MYVYIYIYRTCMGLLSPVYPTTREIRRGLFREKDKIFPTGYTLGWLMGHRRHSVSMPMMLPTAPRGTCRFHHPKNDLPMRGKFYHPQMVVDGIRGESHIFGGEKFKNSMIFLAGSLFHKDLAMDQSDFPLQNVCLPRKMGRTLGKTTSRNPRHSEVCGWKSSLGSILNRSSSLYPTRCLQCPQHNLAPNSAAGIPILDSAQALCHSQLPPVL